VQRARTARERGVHPHSRAPERADPVHLGGSCGAAPGKPEGPYSARDGQPIEREGSERVLVAFQRAQKDWALVQTELASSGGGDRGGKFHHGGVQPGLVAQFKPGADRDPARDVRPDLSLRSG
jgi:hypothetical protein